MTGSSALSVSGVPTAAISRLVTYLRILEELERGGVLTTSSTLLAERAQVSAFQVRKDLAYFGRFGTRGMGYTVSVLKRELTRVLGLNRSWNVVIVGMGRLGQAIANYPAASEYQFSYVGLFDVSPQLCGQAVTVPSRFDALSPVSPTARQLTILHIDSLSDFAAQQNVDMGFLAVPPEHAQAAAQLLVEAGVKGILNFAPTLLQPRTVQKDTLLEIGDEWRDVMIENVDFLVGMKRLAFYMLNPQLKAHDVEETA